MRRQQPEAFSSLKTRWRREGEKVRRWAHLLLFCTRWNFPLMRPGHIKSEHLELVELIQCINAIFLNITWTVVVASSSHQDSSSLSMFAAWGETKVGLPVPEGRCWWRSQQPIALSARVPGWCHRMCWMMEHPHFMLRERWRWESARDPVL